MIAPADWARMSHHARERARRNGLAPRFRPAPPAPVARRRPAAMPLPGYRIRVRYSWDDRGSWTVSDGWSTATCPTWETAVRFAGDVARSLPAAET